ERAVTDAKKDANRIFTLVGDRQVHLAVAVEIARYNRSGSCSSGRAAGLVHRGLETSRPVTDQDTEFVCVLVGNGQVRFAIAVEVGHSESLGIAGCAAAGLEESGGLESAVAIAQQQIALAGSCAV